VIGEEPGGEAPRASGQLVVATLDALFPGGQPGEHPLDPLHLLRAGEAVGDEHHDPFAVTVGGNRSAPALATPHFDDRLTRPGHYRLARPRFGFTYRR
jgi:hypothetical protein